MPKGMRGRNRRKAGYEGDELCSFQLNGFPRALKNRFIAICRANNQTALDVAEYVIAKYLRDLGVDIPPLRRSNEFVFEQLQIQPRADKDIEKGV